MPLLEDPKSSVSTLSKSCQEMVVAGGRLSQLIGFPKSIGQIYGLLMFSDKPMSAEDIAIALAVSKATISNSIRQLSSWGVIQQVWVHGDRKDHYEVIEGFKAVIRAAMEDVLKPRIQSSGQRIQRIESFLNDEKETGEISSELHKLRMRRMKSMTEYHKIIAKTLPLLEKLF
ncbi:HTH domain-containing protein [Verrucomicrobia bacterium]|nr:HTH domain-containing protein [Verrucomicrobiota bacterium]